MGSRAVPGEGRVIKLSDVKVRLQYRWRVRQRLMVLHFARLQGPTAAGRRFGVSVRTIRRWRARWRLDALQGLVPRYPRRRGRRITPRIVELIGQARRDGNDARVWGGMHYPSTVAVSDAEGEAIANYVNANSMQPRSTQSWMRR